MKFPFFFLLNFFFLSIHAQIQIGNDILGESENDRLGFSVFLSSDGTRLAVGAVGGDGNGEDSGHVKIYEDNAGIWTQLGGNIDGESENDISGSNISLSSNGTRVAIGSITNSDAGENAGHVRVYEESNGTWTQIGDDIDGESAFDRSGYAVSISSDGTRIAIGAFLNDGSGSEAGHVRVFDEIDGVWTQIGEDIDGEMSNDRSGASVSLSADGTRVAIGAPYNEGDEGVGIDAGHARIYEETNGEWSQVGSDINAEDEGDEFGYPISLSSDGTRVAVGAISNGGTGENAGHVRIFEESGGTWTQLGEDIDGEAEGDWFGYAISLSADGDYVAIGARRNDGGAENAGHARVFKYTNEIWTQIGNDIDGENADDFSGAALSLSSDGTRLAIGAFGNDNNGENAGYVRVFGEILSPVISEDMYRGKIVQVFPNPSSMLINIQIDNPLNQKMKVQITDNLGQKIWEGKWIEGETVWRKDVEIDESGIYFITAQIGDNFVSKKVIITK